MKMVSIPLVYKGRILKESFKTRNSEAKELRFKKKDDALHFGKHSNNRIINNLSIRSITSFESELNNAPRVHLHIRTTTEIVDGYSIEYCVIFYFGIMDCLNGNLIGQWNLEQSIGSICLDTKAINVSFEENNLDESMFIGSINISEKRQRRIPCLIRLQELNECPLVLGQTEFTGPQSSSSSGSDIPWTITFKDTFTITDGEINSFVETGVLDDPELPEQMVKCRTQVIANISDDKNGINGNFFPFLEPEHMLSLIVIDFNSVDNLIWVTFKKPLNQVIQNLEMISCSAEFEKRAIQRVHMLQYPYGEESGKETKDSEGARDTRAHKGRIPRKSEKGDKINASQLEEVKSQASHDLHHGGCNAKNTHSGSLEDV